MNYISNGLWIMEQQALNDLLLKKPCKPSSCDNDGTDNDESDNCECPETESLSYVNYYGIAVIDVCGVLLKYGCDFEGAVSTIELGNIILQATSDSQIKGILLNIDSPGGQVSGICSLGNLISKCSKPIYAFVSDSCASGAYWLASQCVKIYSNELGLTGSIGVYQVVQDTSKLFENAGVSVQIIKAGEFKGAGTEGTVLTEPQKKEIQRTVNDIYSMFIEKVSQGRKITITEATKLGDGKIWIAKDAKELKLIDDIKTIEDTIGEMINTIQTAGISQDNKEMKLNGINGENMIKSELNKEVIEASVTSVASVETVEASVAIPTVAVVEAVEAIEASVTVAAVEASVTADPAPECTSVEAVAIGEASVAAVESTVAIEAVEAIETPVIALDINKEIKTAKTIGYEEGSKDSIDRLNAVLGVCEGNIAFAIEQFKAGHDKAKAKELFELTKSDSGANPIAISVNTNLKGPEVSDKVESDWDNLSTEGKAAFMNNKEWFVNAKKEKNKQIF